MKENSIGDRIEEKYTRYINCETDILELTIEEAIFILEKDASVHYVEDLLQEAYKVILSDYKRVLKENEELLQEKINNQKIIALAQNDMLNYQAGFEDGKNRRTSAAQIIIENQQYYIFQKQFEKYEEHIKMLQKENEELKNQEATQRKINELLVLRYSNSIPVQKVKDKIEEHKNMLKTCNKAKDIDRIKAINERILELQELLEGRK